MFVIGYISICFKEFELDDRIFNSYKEAEKYAKEEEYGELNKDYWIYELVKR